MSAAEPGPIGRDEILAAVEAAKAQYRPIAPKELRAAKSALKAASYRLDRFLQKQGKRGQAWKNFVQLDVLDAELKERSPNLDNLNGVLERFEGGQPGFEMPVFDEVGNALERYLDLAAALPGPAGEEEYEQNLDELAEDLTAYGTQPTAQLAAQIGETVGRLESLGQAPAIVKAVRGNYSYPNLHVRVSERIVGAGIEGPINDVMPVRDNILGTRVTGTARTRAYTDVVLVPSKNRGIMDITLSGTVYSQTVGRNGPAVICSTGVTKISGSKRTYFDFQGLLANDAQASAHTRTTITGVSVTSDGLLSNLIRKVATRRVYEGKAGAERVASQRAKDRVETRLDQEVDTAAVRVKRELQTQVRDPLKRRNLEPASVRFSSTKDNMYVQVLESGRYQIGAPTAPFPVSGRPELAVQLHETMFNNVAATVFGGERLTEPLLREKLTELLGKVPEGFEPDPDREPWSITFDEELPISAEFADNGFKITIRGRSFTSGERSFPAMNIAAVYKLQADGGAVRAVRQGELEIFPPGFDPEGDESLSVRQQSLRRLLERRFEAVFKPEIVAQGFVLPGRWAKAGRMVASSATSNSGWLAIGWNRDRRPVAKSVAAR